MEAVAEDWANRLRFRALSLRFLRVAEMGIVVGKSLFESRRSAGT